MYTSSAAAANANPILVALRGEIAGVTPQRAAAICAQWLVDLSALVDVTDAAAPVRHAYRVIRHIVGGAR